MIEVKALRENVIEPVLTEIGLYSQNAEELLVATAAHETLMGKYMHQVNGVAMGIYQIEPATFRDIWFRYLNIRTDLKEKIMKACYLVGDPEIEYLYDLRFSTCIARVKYVMNPEPLPAFDDIEAIAKYWKEHYNTLQGGIDYQMDIDNFIKNYNKLVKEV